MKHTCVILRDGNPCPLEICSQFQALSRSVENHKKQINQLRRAFKSKKIPKIDRKHWVDGNSIIRFRQHFNFTQLELSVLLGVHSVTVSRWENGKIGIGNKIQCAILRLNKKSDDAVRQELSVKMAAYLAQ